MLLWSDTTTIMLWNYQKVPRWENFHVASFVL